LPLIKFDLHETTHMVRYNFAFAKSLTTSGLIRSS
jgi:hypothetical protein